METKKMIIKNYPDKYHGDDYIYRQEVIDAETGKTIYSVQDLTDCPEDAIICRDLVSAYDFVDFVKLGIRLGIAGYNDIDIEEVEGEDE